MDVIYYYIVINTINFKIKGSKTIGGTGAIYRL
jgi:hypothetical protein